MQAFVSPEHRLHIGRAVNEGAFSGTSIRLTKDDPGSAHGVIRFMPATAPVSYAPTPDMPASKPNDGIDDRIDRGQIKTRVEVRIFAVNTGPLPGLLRKTGTPRIE